MITRRRVEPFTNVQVNSRSPSCRTCALEVVVNVPERLVRHMRPQQGAVAFLEGDRAVENGTGAPEQALTLELKSFAA